MIRKLRTHLLPTRLLPSDPNEVNEVTMRRMIFFQRTRSTNAALCSMNTFRVNRKMDVYFILYIINVLFKLLQLYPREKRERLIIAARDVFRIELKVFQTIKPISDPLSIKKHMANVRRRRFSMNFQLNFNNKNI